MGIHPLGKIMMPLCMMPLLWMMIPAIQMIPLWIIPTSKHKRKKRQSTGGYTAKKDKCLCEAWVKISQDPICCAEQNGGTYWQNIDKFFHERRKFTPYKIHSDQVQVSHPKRWLFIQEECKKFCGAYKHVVGRPVSGITAFKTW